MARKLQSFGSGRMMKSLKAMRSFKSYADSFAQSPNNAASSAYVISTGYEHKRIWDSNRAVHFYTDAVARAIVDYAIDRTTLSEGNLSQIRRPKTRLCSLLKHRLPRHDRGILWERVSCRICKQPTYIFGSIGPKQGKRAALVLCDRRTKLDRRSFLDRLSPTDRRSSSVRVGD